MPEHLEVAHVPFERGGPYPGIYLFTSAARMARPVRQLPGGSLELVGALEQAHLAVRRGLGVKLGSVTQHILLVGKEQQLGDRFEDGR